MSGSRSGKLKGSLLIAPCGLNCSLCPIYIASHKSIKSRDDKARMDIIGNATCRGCRVEKGGNKAACEIYDCCVNRKRLGFCYQCEEYPCRYLAPASESKASIKKWLSYYNRASPP